MESLSINRIVIGIFLVAGLASGGCDRGEKFDQTYHENFFAAKIARALKFDAAA